MSSVLLSCIRCLVLSLRNKRLALQNRLGIDGKETKVNMGPIKCVLSLELDFHRVLICLGNDITGLLNAHRLCKVNHFRKPLDVLFRIWPKLLNELGRDRHFKVPYLFFLSCKRTWETPLGLAHEHEPQRQENQCIQNQVLCFHLILMNISFLHLPLPPPLRVPYQILPLPRRPGLLLT